MKKLILACCFLSFYFLSKAQLFHERLQQESNLTYQEIIDRTEAYYLNKDKGKGSGYKVFQRWKYWSGRSLDDQGYIISRKESLAAYQKFQKETASDSRNIISDYTEMGPLSQINTSTWSSGLGRVSAIGLDPGDDQHIIVGAPSGGIWKTTDYGSNWTPIFDDQALIDVFSLEISHTDPDVYFAGLNRGFQKSTDGGTTWYQPSGISQNGNYNTIEVHPQNTSHVFALNAGGQIYKSTDEGENFSIVLAASESFIDLEFHPSDPNIIYVSARNAIFKSTNGGNSFTEITTGPWITSGGTVMLAVTPAAVNNVYALQEIFGGFHALYRSQDAGATWTTLSDNSCNCNNIMGYNQNQTGGQAPRDMDIIVSPTNPSIIHVAGVETWKTTNSGGSWNQTTFWDNPGASNFIHADIDLLIYDGNRIVAGTDGGIYYSTDDATSWTDISSGLGIRQFYRIGASATAIDRVSGGSQDNGTGVVKSGQWYDFLGADGMETFIDWSNEDIIYGTVQQAIFLYKSLDGGVTRQTIFAPGGTANWVTPFEQDPINSNTIYVGKSQIYKSTDGGDNWSAISNFSGSGNANELKIAPTNNNRIYAAYFGKLYVTSNGGATWSTTTVSGGVNYITIDPFNADRLTLVMNGSTIKLLESVDGGATFTDITSNFPSNIPLECALYEDVPNGGLYVGGNPGVFYSSSTSSPSWTDVSLNLPKVEVSELEIQNNILYVSTYGRGLWRNDLGSSSNCNGPTQFTGCNVTVEVDGQDVSFVSTTETGTLIIKVRKQDWSEQYDLCNGYNSNEQCTTSSTATVTGTGTYIVDIQGGTGCSTFEITVGGGGGGTDADGDGICSDVDCDDNDASIGAQQQPGTACDDNNSNTTNDVILADGCTCQGTSGCPTDVDGDGVCSTEDCDDNDASVGASQPQNTPCNDGNSNTSFDMIQADGCTCLGTDCGSGGATQFTGCNVTVEVDGQDVRFVSTTETGTLIIKVRRQNWSEQYDLCNDYNGAEECSTSSVATVSGTGTYVVDIQGGTGCSSFNITVDGGGGGGTDADNDGVCDAIDCDDNDASVGEPQPAGTACDDGDSNTTNDVIQADGCTCVGDGDCQTDVDNDGICADQDCDDNDASVGAIQPQYTPCDDGNSNTTFDMIQADGCTCLGTDCSSSATQFTGCNVTVEVDGQDVSFVSTTETGTLIIKIRRQNWSEQYDLCNDYNSSTECSTSSVVTVSGTGTYVVDIQGGTGCSSFNITVGGSGGGTDADNDSVCDLIDCDDNDASVGAPQPQGTSCDDGDSNTTNDVIQADGCTCSGSTNPGANTTSSADTDESEQATSQYGSKTIGAPINEIKIYPNPADNILYVDLHKYAERQGKVEIFNQLGQRQLSNVYISIPSDPVNIDVNQLTSGIYIMVIQVGDNHREIKHFVVIDK